MKNKGINRLIALSLTVALAVVLGVVFDYFYDLNDDVLIKDILSGAYTSTPERRNIQMLFLISNEIGWLYSKMPKVPWEGLVLSFFQYGSILLIITRSLTMLDSFSDQNRRTGTILKIVTGLSETLLLGSLMLSHFVNLHYSITVAFLACAAIMWFITSDTSRNWERVLFSNLPAVILIFMGFLLRSEMMLLMLPFFLVAVLFKWSFESRFFTKENFLRYLAVPVAVALFLLAGQLIHNVAYITEPWREFTSLFNARTQLYDFQQIPPYEGNEEFYDNEGITPTEALLFENYNYGLNPEVDSSMMWKVADYAASLNKERNPFVQKLGEKVSIYIYEITHGKNSTGSDYPWNFALLLGYAAVLYLAVRAKRIRQILVALVLFGGRSIIWIYMLMGERMPERITHSLYFTEIVLLLGMAAVLVKSICSASGQTEIPPAHTATQPAQTATLGFVIALCFCQVLLTALILPENTKILSDNQAQRREVNAPYIDLYTYMMNEPSDYFLMDVYSSVSYSEMVFEKTSRELSRANSDILGGWAYGSVLQNGKNRRHDISDYRSGLLKDNVYFVIDKEQKMDYLTQLYADEGIDISTDLVETIDGVFDIYAIRRK